MGPFWPASRTGVNPGRPSRYFPVMLAEKHASLCQGCYIRQTIIFNSRRRSKQAISLGVSSLHRGLEGRVDQGGHSPDGLLSVSFFMAVSNTPASASPVAS